MSFNVKAIAERVAKTVVASALATGAVGPALVALSGGHLDLTASRQVYVAVSAACVSLVLNVLTSFVGDKSTPSLVKGDR